MHPCCSEHVIFTLIKEATRYYDKIFLKDIVAILQHMITVDPGLLHLR